MTYDIGNISFLYKARHLIVIAVILKVLLKVLIVSIESDDLRAVAELHVGVGEDSEALQEDLLAGDLLLARHLAHLQQEVRWKLPKKINLLFQSQSEVLRTY